MAKDYVIRQGDCISSIAFRNGFDWITLWNEPANAELKERRKDPNLLFPGDVVHIPDLRLKEVDRPTDQCHSFKVKNVPAKLRLRLLGAEDEDQSAAPAPAGSP